MFAFKIISMFLFLSTSALSIQQILVSNYAHLYKAAEFPKWLELISLYPLFHDLTCNLFDMLELKANEVNQPRNKLPSFVTFCCRIFFFCKNCQIKRSVKFVFVVFSHKVPEIGSHSARAKGPTKISSGGYLLFLQQMHFFACNCNLANLIQFDMQYIPCNNALLAKETLLLSLNSTVLPKSSEKCIEHDKS